jgi:hypothetical protein
LDSLSETIVNTEIEWQDTIRTINEDMSISVEEKQRKIAEANEFYGSQINYLYDEMNKSLSYNTQCYERDLAFRESLDDSFTAKYGLSV